MRIFLDSTCPRCGARSSSAGISLDVAREITRSHVCADGVSTISGEPVERIVLGPGERTKLPEEKDVAPFADLQPSIARDRALERWAKS